MNYRHIILVILLSVFISLGCNNQSQENSVEEIPKPESVHTQDDIEINNEDCSSAVKEFLSWYKIHFDSLKALQLVDLIEDSVNVHYRINFNNAQKYIGELKASGLFTEEYLENLLRYFKERDGEFVKENQSDGPPIGFEADLLLHTQEPELVLKNFASLKIEYVKPLLLKLVSIDNDLVFEFKVKDGRCLIESIKFMPKRE